MSEILWVGCFTEGDNVDGLARLEVERDASALRVTETGRWPMASPGWLEERDGIVYAAQHLEDSAALSMRLTPEGPQVISRVTTQGSDACHLALSPAGDQLAVAHYTSGSLSLLSVADDGHLELVDVLQFSGASGEVPDRQDAPHAHQAHWLDDTEVLVCDLGADRIRRVRVDDGSLRELSALETPDGFGPRHLVVRDAGRGRQLAVGGELTGQVATFALDEDGWTLLGVAEGSASSEAKPSGLRLDEQGRLFVGQRGVNTISVMPWHEDGTVGAFTEWPTDGGEVRDLVLHPATAPVTVWTALQERDAVTALVEDADGALHQQVEVTLPTPGALLFHDDRR